MRLPQGLILLFALLLPAVQAAILAIDYGAEFTKLSLVKPGLPLDVLLDRDSKRKISSVVSWKRDDRVFGQEGKMAASRFPQTHFPYVKPLLASTDIPGEPIYPQPPVPGADGTLMFPHPKVPAHVKPKPDSHDAVWTPTDILAHQISYFKGLAEEAAAPEAVTQAVVTVPAWWNQAQRRAYRDALELQGLSCLAMIGEGSGVALNYAMTRTFPDYDPETGVGEKEYHVVYDSGGLTTSATVLAMYQTSFRPSPKSTTLINTTHIDLVSVGWEDVGGVHLDLAVQELITDDFVKQSGLKAARKDPKAVAKLQKEAVRVKQILSANQESTVAIEGVYDDTDFRSRLSRVALEKKFEDKSRFTHPLTEALENAGLTLDNISSVLLFGGNTRVPFVQTALREVLGKKEDLIAQGVNTDEAAVLGAAFYAAGLSRQFKMKSIEVSERSLYDITYDNEVVFPAGSIFGERKNLLLKPKDEMTVEFAQDGTKILGVDLTNVKDVLVNFTAPEPVVNMTVRLDSRGIFSVANAALVSNETTVETKEGGVAGALKGLFGKKDGEEETDETEHDKTDDTAKVKAVKPKKERVAIKFRESPLGIKPLSGDQKRVTNQRLNAIATYEAGLRARADALNLLEGYLYRLQNLLTDDSDNRALHDFATPEERKRLSDLVANTFEWLHENTETADVKTLLGKRTAIETLELPIITRFTEWGTRGKAIDNFQKAMFAGRAFHEEAVKNRTEALAAVEAAPSDKPAAPPKFTQEELDSVKTLLDENATWMDGLMEIQVKQEEDMTADPVILSKDMDDRGKKLQMLVQRLEKKKNPRAPRPPRPSTASSAAPEETSAEAEQQEEKDNEVPKHEEL